MAARRLGTVLTNITGTSGQILRVKTDESGFEFYTPAGLPTYTNSNVTTDRSYDADITTIDELADVLGTLIADINTLIGGPVAFQWSSSEQVYPFEKAADGSTLYCKEINFGAWPNNGTKSVPHGITWIGGFDTTKLHRIEGRVWNDTATWVACIPYAHPTDGFSPATYITATDISLYNQLDLSNWSCVIRLIYKK
jgi:hypothetical protein